MRYVEAPEWYDGGGPSVFLAGGISGCPPWQAHAVEMLADTPLAVFNPRRAEFPMDDPSAAAGQIEWEFRHLRVASMVLFWFPGGGAVQPIALYELGFHAGRQKPIAVGCSLDYPRRADVYHQLRLARPGLPVLSSLGEVVAAVREELVPAPSPEASRR
jgi:hypothetical protein